MYGDLYTARDSSIHGQAICRKCSHGDPKHFGDGSLPVLHWTRCLAAIRQPYCSDEVMPNAAQADYHSQEGWGPYACKSCKKPGHGWCDCPTEFHAYTYNVRSLVGAVGLLPPEEGANAGQGDQFPTVC